MKLSTQLQENIYKPPSPAELAKKTKTQKQAKKKVLTTLGEGPPYRVVKVESERYGDIIQPCPCDHCGTRLRAKLVHIEDKEGQEFIIGSSCAKKIGGTALANWVKELEESQALEALRTAAMKHKPQLEAIPYNLIARGTFPYGKWSSRNIMKKQSLYSRRGIKKTAFSWVWDMLNSRLNTKEMAAMAKLITDPEQFID